MRDRPGDGIRCSGGVGFLVSEERSEISGCGEANAKHERILDRVLQFVQKRWIEAVLYTDLCRIRLAGKRRGRAICECPVAARNFHDALLRARRRLAGGRDET